MLYSEINGQGTVNIDDSVICQIIEETVEAEFKGRVWISNKKSQVSSFMTKFGGRNVTDDIEMYLERGQVYVKMYIIIKFGLSIKGTTDELIQRLKETIEEKSLMPVKEVTLVVNGVMAKHVVKRYIETLGDEFGEELVVVPRAVALERTRSIVPITHKEAYNLVTLLFEQIGRYRGVHATRKSNNNSCHRIDFTNCKCSQFSRDDEILSHFASPNH